MIVEGESGSDGSGIPPLLIYISVGAIAAVTLVAIIVVVAYRCQRNDRDRYLISGCCVLRLNGYCYMWGAWDL